MEFKYNKNVNIYEIFMSVYLYTKTWLSFPFSGVYCKRNYDKFVLKLTTSFNDSCISTTSIVKVLM